MTVGIRTRLGLWYGAALALTLVGLGILVWTQFGAALRESIDDALHIQVADVRAALTTDPRNVIRFDPARPGVFTIVYVDGGRIDAASRGVPPGLSEPAEGASTVMLGSPAEEYAVYAEPGPDDRRIVAGESLAEANVSVASLARLLAIVGVGGLLLSIAGGWWLAGRALAPVVAMTHEADAIGLTDLDRRISIRVSRDELGQLAQTINRMLDRVEAAVRRERAFVVAASHDLRTPITALRAELELAERGNGSRDELLVAVHESHADAVRLSELTADLLQLAEADVHGRQLLRQPVSVREVLDAAVRRVETIARERGVRLVPNSTDAIVDVDRVRLEQAISNLMANAVREAPRGSAVDLEAYVDGVAGGPSSLTVRVSDRGPGVARELREFLFVPFAARSPDRGHGHGLGLAVAAAAVQAHEGTIAYEDRVGGGAVFWLCVPC